MSQIIRDLKVRIDEDLEEKLSYLAPDFSSFRILKKSVDARGSKKPHWIYNLEVFDQGEVPPELGYEQEKLSNPPKERPIIVGAGPAGLFAALRFVERGIPCTLIERGSPCEKRLRAINRYWRYGELDANDNVCFGEGGAGLYSDGKLITRIKSPHIPYVMHRLVKFGAPEEIKYLANPHVGSDRIRKVIPVMRKFLIEQGCDIRFNTPMRRLLIEGDRVQGVELENGEKLHSPWVLLATGHSATDIFEELRKQGVFMEGKSFAVGLRIEHPQGLINKIQYRDHSEHPELGAANYRLAHHDKDSGVGVYSFCMCPGGYVLSSGTEADGVVSNGMSNYRRNSAFANAAIVVSVDFEKHFKGLFEGLEFRRKLEKDAFRAVQEQGGTKELPAQNVQDFLSNRLGEVTKGSSPSGQVPVRWDKLLPESIYLRLVQALEQFDNSMKGFLSPHAQLYGIESRTSCPIRITRDTKTLQSLSHKGLYPLGEGAGYAGGITSAACDGVNTAEVICEIVSSQSLRL